MSRHPIERIHVAGLPRGGAYVDAVRHRDLVFLSGLVGVDADLALAGADAEAQTHRIFASLQLVLDRLQLGMVHVLKMTTFLTDMRDRETVAMVRQAYLGDVLPAATLVAVSALVLPELRVEMDFTLAAA